MEDGGWGDDGSKKGKENVRQRGVCVKTVRIMAEMVDGD